MTQLNTPGQEIFDPHLKNMPEAIAADYPRRAKALLSWRWHEPLSRIITRGVEFIGQIYQQPWGRMASFKFPRGGGRSLCQTRHPIALGLQSKVPR